MPAIVLAIILSSRAIGAIACQGAPSVPGSSASTGTKEVRGLRDARVPLDKAADAAAKNDWKTAKASFDDYFEAWNGIEQYVRVRSLELYRAIEDPFNDIQKQLESSSPNASETTRL